MGRTTGFLTQILLARILAPQNFGLFAIGWMMLRLFAIFGHLGFDYGVIRFGAPHYPSDISKFKNIGTLAVLAAITSGLLLGALQFTVGPWVAQNVFNKPGLTFVFLGFAAAYPFATTLRVLAATISITTKAVWGATIEDLVQPISQIVFFLILLLCGTDEVLSAFLSTTLSYVLACCLATVFLSRVIPGLLAPSGLSTEAFIPLASYSLPAILGASMGAFNLWGDRLLVGFFGSARDTGLYQSISLISTFTITLISGLKISFSPRIAAFFSQENIFGIVTISRTASRWALYLSLPVLSTIMLNSGGIMGIIFGNEFRGAEFPLVILTFGQIFYVLFGISDQVFLMTGNQRIWLLISGIVFILTITLDGILIPRYHLIGASLVSSGMLLLLGCTSLAVLHRRLGIAALDVYHFKLVGSASLSTLIVALGNTFFDLAEPPRIIINFFAISFIFLFTAGIVGLEPTDFHILRNFFSTRNEK